MDHVHSGGRRGGHGCEVPALYQLWPRNRRPHGAALDPDSILAIGLAMICGSPPRLWVLGVPQAAASQNVLLDLAVGKAMPEQLDEENYADYRRAIHDLATVHAMCKDYRAGLGGVGGR